MSTNASNERTPLLPASFQNNPRKITLAWADPTDPNNPQNWPASRKWHVAIIVSFYALSAPMSSAMVVPAMPEMSQELGLTSESSSQLLVSGYVLCWSLGTLLWGPLSEVYGRPILLHYSQALFLLTNSLCALEWNGTRFLALRSVSGLVGSAPLAIGGGVMSDLWKSEERGRSLAVYAAVPLLGPALGAIVGGFVVQSISWRWIFWGCSAFSACSLVVGLVFLTETFAPVILRQGNITVHGSEPNNPVKRLSVVLRKLITVDLPRPAILLATQPIIQTLALYMAYLYGLNFLTISTYQTLWQDAYGQSVSIGSLNYISIGLGLVLGCEVAGPLNDKIYVFCKSRNNNVGVPEFRTYMMIPASVLVPAGLLWYGWSSQAHLHWIMPNIGIGVYCFGLIVGYQCIQAYVLDCYPVYAASAIGALTILRAITGCVFPLFGPALFRRFGYGWASTLLAGVAAVIGGLAPIGLRLAGPRLRARSPYASGHVQIHLLGSSNSIDTQRC